MPHPWRPRPRVVVCALIVAIFLPWGAQQGESVLLGWRKSTEHSDS